VHYKLVLLLQSLGREEAQAELRKALDLEPSNMYFFYALADHYLSRNEIAAARGVVAQMIERPSENSLGQRLMHIIDQLSNDGKKVRPHGAD
jgi:predicted Zn-dependent protease